MMMIYHTEPATSKSVQRQQSGKPKMLGGIEEMA